MNLKRITLVLLSISLAFSLYAQESVEIEEVIVTATKREVSLQEIPFSVNVQSEETLRRIGASSIEDVSRNIAALTVQNLGPGQSQVAIRGVSAGQIVRDQPGVKEQVGIYLDESVVSLSLFTPDFDLFDLNRVETLRGPQGTLYGSGSLGGTIRYITNQPKLNVNESSIQIDGHSIFDGGLGGHLKGVVNFPISDSAAARLVGYTTSYGGFIDAHREGGDLAEDVNSGNTNGFRASVLMELNEQLKITPRLVVQQIEMDGFNRMEVFNLFGNPFTTTRQAVYFSDRQQYLLLDEGFSDDIVLFDLTASYEFDTSTLTSVTSLIDRDILVSRDASALTGSVSVDLGYPDAAVSTPSNLRDTTALQQFTQEARLHSTTDTRLHWLVGFFTTQINRDYAQRLPTPGYDGYTDGVFGAGTSDAVRNGFSDRDSPFNSDLPYDISQMALFGEINYEFNDRLNVTAGGRWYDFEEERTITTGGLFANGDFRVVDTTSSSGFNPRLMAAYEVNENLTLNAQASRGFRLGGVNDPLNTPACTPGDLQTFGSFQSYGDEFAWNYEGGLKGSWANGIELKVAVFQSNIEDLQVTLDAGSCSSRISFNVAEAHASGLEYEFNVRPSPNLLLSVAGSSISSEFDTTVIAETGGVLGGVEDGNRLASVPKTQFALAVDYARPTTLLGGTDMFFIASTQFVGKRITQPSDQVAGAGVFASGLAYGGASGTNETILNLDLKGYFLTDLRIGLAQEAWTATVYVRNLFDKVALLSFDRERGGRARLGFRTNQPRTIGVRYQRYM